MVSAARLKRLTKLVQADLDALPDRPVLIMASMVNNHDSGGVLLAEPQSPTDMPSKQPAVGPSIKAESVTNEAHANAERRFVWVAGIESSYNLGAMSPPIALPATDLNRGDLAPAQHHFAPILALAKYPYKFCNKSHSQDIASAFFDQGKFWNRKWDLYYIWDVGPANVLVLVRETQFQDLLKEINNHLKLALRITDSHREEGLVVRFPDHPACLPRYLGRSHSREQHDNMASNAPDRAFRAAGELPHGPPNSGTLEQFKQMMEDLWDAQKTKNKAKKAAKQIEKISRQTSMVDQMKRAQRYLGLRASESNGQTTPIGAPRSINTLLPAPFEFQQSVVFICVDVESYERAHHKITEIGIATLDTRDLADIAPGKDGEAWRKIIKARHFRINEHRHLINHEFVHGYPDGFEFGESTFVSLKEAPNHVAACFHQPFGALPSNTAEDAMINNAMRDLDLIEKRNLVFLGHDTLSDVHYLQKLGHDPMKVENIIEAMDTAKMYQAWRRDPQPTNLGRIMSDFDVAAWKLHNAGNDAVYTVQAMLAICVREASIRGSVELEAMRQEDKTVRLAASQKAAMQRAQEDAEGWSDSEANRDGGAPIPLNGL